jgi:hypothetical protein
MRRLRFVLGIIVLFSVVQIVAAQPSRIERKERKELAATATPARAPMSVRSASSSAATLAPATTLTTTTALSPTTALSSTTPLTPTQPLTTTRAFTATVIGYVREAGTQKPIADANVVVGGVAITTRTDGTFGPVEIPLPDMIVDVDASATADGYEPWTFRGVPLRDAGKLDIHIQLRPKGTPTPVAPAPPRPQPSEVGTPPETIRLAITGSSKCVIPSPGEYRVVEIPFADYLRGVLPNEWIASWPDASLDAGAVAVKQYAWYTAFVGRKWSSQGYDFDLLDSTCDQHYVAGDFDPRTDAALQRTWNITLTRDSALFPTYYRAYDEQCVRSGSADCMGQWGTEELARAGMNGVQILGHYYKNAVVEGLPRQEPTPRQNPVFLPLVARP